MINTELRVETEETELNKYLERAIYRSQRCQRNWDLSKKLAEKDIKTIITAATECPTKQNTPFFNLYAITDRDIINQIYETTETPKFKNAIVRKNPQVLANLVLVYTHNEIIKKKDVQNVDQYKDFLNTATEEDKIAIFQDRLQAVGISAGYVNLTASLLGYQSGCCKCFDRPAIQNIIGTTNEPMLIMGVGIKDPNKPRREDHVTGDTIGSFNKTIEVTRIY